MILSVKNGLLMAGICASLTILNAHADPFQIPGLDMDIPKNGTGPITDPNGNSPSDDFFRLQNVVTAYNIAHPTAMLPTPVLTGFETVSSSSLPSPDLNGFDFAVLHYGVGDGGNQGSGGGIELFFLNGASGFNFPANGTGPNGFGGFSGGVLYAFTAQTPECPGLLMGLVAGMLAVTHRFFRAKAT